MFSFLFHIDFCSIVLSQIILVKMPINAFQRIFDFGSKKDDTKNVSSSDAIKHLCDVEEMLNKKQQHLESQIEEEKTTHQHHNISTKLNNANLFFLEYVCLYLPFYLSLE